MPGRARVPAFITAVVNDAPSPAWRAAT